MRLTGRRVNGAAQLRQSAQCCRHRLGVRVVRVVNDGHAVGTVGASHTPLRSCRRLVERASNLLTRNAAVVGDCRRSQQVVHVVLTDQLRGNLVLATVRQAQSELGATGIGSTQVQRRNIAFVGVTVRIGLLAHTKVSNGGNRTRCHA